MNTGHHRHLCSITVIFLSAAYCLVPVATGAFLWFEDIPDPDNPCTLVKYGTTKMDVSAIHPDPNCFQGALMWLGTWGRIRAYFTLGGTQDFEICLTGGEANAIYIFYDYLGKFFEPIGFPMYMGIPPRHEMCKVSHNGSLTLMIDSPWGYPNYYSFLTWEISPLDSAAAKKMQEDYAYEKMKHRIPFVKDDNEKDEEDEEDDDDDDSWF